jgi:hypothetical protein
MVKTIPKFHLQSYLFIGNQAAYESVSCKKNFRYGLKVAIFNIIANTFFLLYISWIVQTKSKQTIFVS